MDGRFVIVRAFGGEPLRRVAYTGIVQSIEDNGQSAPRDKRWRVTILA